MSNRIQIVNVEDVLPDMEPAAQRELLQSFIPVRNNRRNMRGDIGNLLENQENEQENQENVLERSIPARLLAFLHLRNPNISIHPQPQDPTPRTSASRERRRNR
ncbi:hypothetical protein CC99x_002660 [Candidatus Berkiella cookevillensis]|uniref:Uncharacterized protein n=1 Tax=Candidatus Berkiella cookevillensis TaxID=437022 RepID=A0A0Q9YDM5_9GAMM|nr:hypothetical protein [Candidatus Berkiella cookevillensis]MCS5707799.1 hypothetical protein [Candidatus Berkiella cookevillensis]